MSEEIKIEYPKWLYHATKDAVIVHNEDQEKDLGKGWKDSPAHFIKDEEKKDKKEQE